MKKIIASFFNTIVNEYNDTKSMIKTIFKKSKTKEDKEKIKKQLKEIIIMILMIPFLILPGGSLALVVIYKLADYVNFDIKLKKTF